MLDEITETTEAAVETNPAESFYSDDSDGVTEEPAVDEIDGEEAESASTDDEADDLPEDVYYDIDGEEVSASDIRKWKSGHMKDADYTQKTQILANDRKAVSADRETVSQRLETLESLESELEQLVMGDLANVDLDELLNEDSTEYLRTEKAIETRKSKLKQAYEKLAEVKESVLNEAHQQLHTELGWADTAKRQADIESIQSYVKDAGIPTKEFSKVTNPKVMTAILEASKYRKLMEGKPSINKRVTQAPKTSKPSKTNKTQKPKQPWERMYGSD